MKDTGLQTFESDDCFQFYKALENIENLNHIVDDLNQGENHKDHEGEPRGKILLFVHRFNCFRLISCTRMLDKHTLFSKSFSISIYRSEEQQDHNGTGEPTLCDGDRGVQLQDHGAGVRARQRAARDTHEIRSQ